MSDVINVAIIGKGSAASRHERVAKRISSKIRTSVFSSRDFEMYLDGGKSRRPFNNLDVFDAAIIASPAPQHLRQASFFLDNSRPVLIEKPLASDLRELKLFFERFKLSQHLIQVGYPLRRSSGMSLIHEFLSSGELGGIKRVEVVCHSFLPNWRTISFWDSVSSKKSLGGGVLNELSHELDYVQDLFGDLVYESGNLTYGDESGLEVEEAAYLKLSGSSQEPIGIDLNFWSRAEDRSCTIFAEKGTLKWSLSLGSLTVEKNNKTHKSFSLDDTLERMFESQMKAFIDLVQNPLNKSSINSELYDAIRVVEIIDQAKKEGVTKV